MPIDGAGCVRLLRSRFGQHGAHTRECRLRILSPTDMCTVTFIPKPDGFLLAMNRDDRFSRSQTIAPQPHTAGSRSALYPAEPGGGTWIGANDAGLALVLLNWNRPGGKQVRSRGLIIPSLLAAGSLREVSGGLASESLNGTHPFRLIGFSGNERSIREWRWDGRLASVDLPWEHGHWFSSGLSDEQAAAQRGADCRQALAEPDALSLEWVRRLHRSHGPAPGPFSICAHRETAGTLSYTEIVALDDSVTMSYTSSSPCQEQPTVISVLPLRAPGPSLAY